MALIPVEENLPYPRTIRNAIASNARDIKNLQDHVSRSYKPDILEEFQGKLDHALVRADRLAAVLRASIMYWAKYRKVSA